MANKKEFITTEVFNEATGRWEKQKVYGVSDEIIDFMNRSKWKEEAQWKRDHYYQETKIEKELPDEKRYAFDNNHLPKNVSLDSIMDAGGEGNLPYEPDFSDDVVDLMERNQRLQFLLMALSELTGEDMTIVKHFYIEGRTGRDYEATYGVPRRTIEGRRDKLLARLKIFIQDRMRSK